MNTKICRSINVDPKRWEKFKTHCKKKKITISDNIGKLIATEMDETEDSAIAAPA